MGAPPAFVHGHAVLGQRLCPPRGALAFSGKRHCAHADLVSSRFCVSGYTELAKWSARASVKVMNKGMEAPSPPTIGPLGVNGGEERNPTALNPGASARLPSAEARLIEQLRQGDPEAGHQFARDYYPDVYRYLLYLTGRAEMAEDLAQETFLHAWRRLDTFEGRASLRVWLPRIAHREV